MAQAQSVLSLRSTLITLGYVVVAIGFTFMPGIGLEWFEAPRAQVLIGGIATAISLGALHLFRYRWPVAIVTAGLIVMIIEAFMSGSTSAGAILIECDAIYTLVLARSTIRSRQVLPIVAAVCFFVSTAGLLLGNILPDQLLQFTILLLPVGVTVWWGLTVRTPMDRAEEERERADLVALAASARQREALASERLQISRELHDAISGHLSAIAIQSAGARAGSAPLTSEDLTEQLARIRALSLDAMGDMHTLIEVLRADTAAPPKRSQNWTSVDSLIDRARESGASATVTGIDPSSISLDPLVSDTAHSTLREALVNAQKHAPGMDVRVDLRITDTILDITVSNARDRSAAVEAVSTGYGLIGLAERIRLCRGHLDIHRSDDSWTLQVQLPLTTELEAQHAHTPHRR